MHLQDGIYSLGIDDPGLSAILGGDARFRVFSAEETSLQANRGAFDLVIIRGGCCGP
jgi:hypothetical protein